MTLTHFKKAIQYYGEENILSIQFDNYSARLFTSTQPFKLAVNLKEDIECLLFPASDTLGNVFETCIPLSEIKMILAKPSDMKHEDYVRESLRG